MKIYGNGYKHLKNEKLEERSIEGKRQKRKEKNIERNKKKGTYIERTILIKIETIWTEKWTRKERCKKNHSNEMKKINLKQIQSRLRRVFCRILSIIFTCKKTIQMYIA